MRLTDTSPQVGGSTRGYPARATTQETTNQVPVRRSVSARTSYVLLIAFGFRTTSAMNVGMP